MKKLLIFFTLIIFMGLNLAIEVSASEDASKYLTYTTTTADFTDKRLHKNYKKRIIEVKNISSLPLKLTWSQLYNDINAQQAYNTCYYITTAGSQWTAFGLGATIIGVPFGIQKATKMVQNKNNELLDEINTYKNEGNPNFGTIVNPGETVKLHLIEKQSQQEPAHIKVRFENENKKILTEIDCVVTK